MVLIISVKEYKVKLELSETFLLLQLARKEFRLLQDLSLSKQHR